MNAKERLGEIFDLLATRGTLSAVEVGRVLRGGVFNGKFPEGDDALLGIVSDPSSRPRASAGFDAKEFANAATRVCAAAGVSAEQAFTRLVRYCCRPLHQSLRTHCHYHQHQTHHPLTPLGLKQFLTAAAFPGCSARNINKYILDPLPTDASGTVSEEGFASCVLRIGKDVSFDCLFAVLHQSSDPAWDSWLDVFPEFPPEATEKLTKSGKSSDSLRRKSSLLARAPVARKKDGFPPRGKPADTPFRPPVREGGIVRAPSSSLASASVVSLDATVVQAARDTPRPQPAGAEAGSRQARGSGGLPRTQAHPNVASARPVRAEAREGIVTEPAGGGGARRFESDPPVPHPGAPPPADGGRAGLPSVAAAAPPLSPALLGAAGGAPGRHRSRSSKKDPPSPFLHPADYTAPKSSSRRNSVASISRESAADDAASTGSRRSRGRDPHEQPESKAEADDARSSRSSRRSRDRSDKKSAKHEDKSQPAEADSTTLEKKGAGHGRSSRQGGEDDAASVGSRRSRRDPNERPDERSQPAEADDARSSRDRKASEKKSTRHRSNSRSSRQGGEDDAASVGSRRSRRDPNERPDERSQPAEADDARSSRDRKASEKKSTRHRSNSRSSRQGGEDDAASVGSRRSRRDPNERPDERSQPAEADDARSSRDRKASEKKSTRHRSNSRSSRQGGEDDAASVGSRRSRRDPIERPDEKSAKQDDSRQPVEAEKKGAGHSRSSRHGGEDDARSAASGRSRDRKSKSDRKGAAPDTGKAAAAPGKDDDAASATSRSRHRRGSDRGQAGESASTTSKPRDRRHAQGSEEEADGAGHRRSPGVAPSDARSLAASGSTAGVHVPNSRAATPRHAASFAPPPDGGDAVGSAAGSKGGVAGWVVGKSDGPRKHALASEGRLSGGGVPAEATRSHTPPGRTAADDAAVDLKPLETGGGGGRTPPVGGGGWAAGDARSLTGGQSALSVRGPAMGKASSLAGIHRETGGSHGGPSAAFPGLKPRSSAPGSRRSSFQSDRDPSGHAQLGLEATLPQRGAAAGGGGGGAEEISKESDSEGSAAGSLFSGRPGRGAAPGESFSSPPCGFQRPPSVSSLAHAAHLPAAAAAYHNPPALSPRVLPHPPPSEAEAQAAAAAEVDPFLRSAARLLAQPGPPCAGCTELKEKLAEALSLLRRCHPLKPERERRGSAAQSGVSCFSLPPDAYTASGAASSAGGEAAPQAGRKVVQLLPLATPQANRAAVAPHAGETRSVLSRTSKPEQQLTITGKPGGGESGLLENQTAASLPPLQHPTRGFTAASGAAPVVPHPHDTPDEFEGPVEADRFCSAASTSSTVDAGPARLPGLSENVMHRDGYPGVSPDDEKKGGAAGVHVELYAGGETRGPSAARELSVSVAYFAERSPKPVPPSFRREAAAAARSSSCPAAASLSPRPRKSVDFESPQLLSLSPDDDTPRVPRTPDEPRAAPSISEMGLAVTQGAKQPPPEVPRWTDAPVGSPVNRQVDSDCGVSGVSRGLGPSRGKQAKLMYKVPVLTDTALMDDGAGELAGPVPAAEIGGPPGGAGYTSWSIDSATGNPVFQGGSDAEKTWPCGSHDGGLARVRSSSPVFAEAGEAGGAPLSFSRGEAAREEVGQEEREIHERLAVLKKWEVESRQVNAGLAQRSIALEQTRRELRRAMAEQGGAASNRSRSAVTHASYTTFSPPSFDLAEKAFPGPMGSASPLARPSALDAFQPAGHSRSTTPSRAAAQQQAPAFPGVPPHAFFNAPPAVRSTLLAALADDPLAQPRAASPSFLAPPLYQPAAHPPSYFSTDL
ncbi:hypothetical protein DIPPA_23352 [Diplonema papillatum]|nr:hypothetical protein DIPPA_23352 [Diplonema papillatum]